MPQVGLPDFLQLCKIFRCLYTPYVKINGFMALSSTKLGHRNFNYDIIGDFFIR
jgi:hypothetical protein